MDRVLEKKKGLQKKHLPYIGGGVVLLLIAGWLVFGDHSSSLKVDRRMLTIGTAQRGQFNDNVSVNGSVLPITTVQISPLESGNVDTKVVEEGAMVRKGDVIIKLTNPQLNMEILNSEANLAYQENELRNTRVSMEQEKLNLQQERLQVEMSLTRARRKYEQCAALEKENLISHEEYLQAKEDYELTVQQKELVYERQQQDSTFRSHQVENMEISLESMKRNMQLIRQRVDNLNVRANIDGELGQLDVVLGQYVNAGTKVGQINDLSDYKVEAQVDEHYVDRVHTGLSATFEQNGRKYDLTVRKVYPEVRNGRFKIDFTFSGPRPKNIRTGQTYYADLQLGESKKAIIIPKGTFYSVTGGTWIFVLDSEGRKAYRRKIRIGRQNPEYCEVTEGLEPGERVIVSGYEAYKDSETLVLE